jgi:hypothetical protein
MQQMISCWRNLWKAELPFLIVQLASFEEMMEPLDFVPIRAAQERLTKSCEKVWLACAMMQACAMTSIPSTSVRRRAAGASGALEGVRSRYPRGFARAGRRKARKRFVILRFAQRERDSSAAGKTPET